MFGVKIALKIAAVTGTGGLLLALAGVSGAVASSARKRRREIGIRMALGATPARVVSLIAREGIVIAGLGAALGLLIGRFFATLLKSFVPGSGQSANTAAAILVTLACVIASVAPALDASRTDPANTLRD
jgi:ABC-type antimicrobial peptide transport system permease subunit